MEEILRSLGLQEPSARPKGFGGGDVHRLCRLPPQFDRRNKCRTSSKSSPSSASLQLSALAPARPRTTRTSFTCRFSPSPSRPSTDHCDAGRASLGRDDLDVPRPDPCACADPAVFDSAVMGDDMPGDLWIVANGEVVAQGRRQTGRIRRRMYRNSFPHCPCSTAHDGGPCSANGVGHVTSISFSWPPSSLPRYPRRRAVLRVTRDPRQSSSSGQSLPWTRFSRFDPLMAHRDFRALALRSAAPGDRT